MGEGELESIAAVVVSWLTLKGLSESTVRHLGGSEREELLLGSGLAPEQILTRELALLMPL